MKNRRNRQVTTSVPVEDQSSMKPVLAICFCLLVFSVWLRYSIFGFGYGPIVTAKSYDKPVKIERLVLPKEKLPAGVFKEEVKRLDKDEDKRRVLQRYELKNLSCKTLIVALFRGQGESHAQLILDFATKAEAEKVTPVIRVQDTRAIVLHGMSKTLAEAIGKHADEEKKLRTKVLKLRTAGNASFCFFMDLLVGAFFFVLALFLAKYFLIVRNLEE